MRRFFLFLLAGLLLAACTPKSEMDRYIDDLMSRMTLEQRIGQLNLHSAPGFISAERVTEEDENMESGAGIPLLFGLDVIHGHETVLP